MPTTSPDSLFYPDDASGPDLTQHLQDLADNIQSVFTASETWTSWTPTFDLVVHGGFNSLGTGGLRAGHYRRSRPGSGALIYAEFRFRLGTSPTVTTGSSDSVFVLQLPVTAHAWSGANRGQTLGRWTLRDDNVTGTYSGNGIVHQSGTLGLFGASDGLDVHFSRAVDLSNGIANRRIDDDDPITWAVNDVLTGHLLYRAA